MNIAKATAEDMMAHHRSIIEEFRKALAGHEMNPTGKISSHVSTEKDATKDVRTRKVFGVGSGDDGEGKTPVNLPNRLEVVVVY